MGKNGTLLIGEGDSTVPAFEKDPDDDLDDEDIPLISVEENVNKQDDATDEETLKSPFMPGAENLRGIGVILVVLYHMGYNRFLNAWFAISLFFSLSGFLMTKNTVESFERRGYVDVYKFWAKRISRLFPALLVTLILILLSQKLPFRENLDGITFQREATDVWYATLFLTNYNLAYLQVDDYFSDFLRPSVTRHLWTLSIEEQYYIIWPVVLFLITKIVTLLSKNDEDKKNKQCEGGQKRKNRYIISGISKNCIQAILMLDICVMIWSYVSSHMLIEKYGVTQAYYSTMCRMGDIAAGGFTYSIVRLHPYLSRRWFRDPSLPPLTFNMRVILEFLSLILLLLLVSVPMIQIPVEDMLVYYFDWLRLLISVMLSGVVANTIQLSEPLPRWAIVSKLANFIPLTIAGIISYEVYVFHWPILIYFGDPRALSKQRAQLGWDDPYDGFLNYEFRNVLLFISFFLVGYIAFFYVDLPCLNWSKASPPKKTIAIGMVSIGITLVIHWLVSKDLPPMITFTNEEAFDKAFDSRFTPIFFASQRGDIKFDLFLDTLDYQTRSAFPTAKSDYKKIHVDYANPEFDGADARVIIACKNIVGLERSPCGFSDYWVDNTYWLWLDSPQLCRNKDYTINTQLAFDERCDDAISIAELPVFESPVPISEINGEDDSELTLLAMLLGVDEVFPGVLNQDSVSRFNTAFEHIISGDKNLSSENSVEDMWDSITIMTLGDSVASRIGMFWNDIVEIDMPILDNDPFPSASVRNLGSGGLPAVAYFACLSTHPKYQYDQCHQFTTSTPKVTLDSFESNKPNVVFISDGHHAGDDRQFGQTVDKMGLATFFEKIMAFNIMMNEAKKSDVQHIIFSTSSRVDIAVKKLEEAYFKELNLLMQTVDLLGCQKGDPSGMWLTVLDWSRLVCPKLEEDRACKQEAHGFDNILPDKIHPSGDSGLWLTREAFALTIAEIAKYSLPDEFGLYSTWDEAIGNPISKRMLELAPPDGDPFLKDIVSSYYLCPYKDLEKLEEDYEEKSFPEYKNYKESAHYDVFDADKNLAFLDIHDNVFGNSNQEFDWYEGVFGKGTEDRYDHSVVLNGPGPSDPENKAVIRWAVNATHIRLAVAAPSTGYLGFGLTDASGGFQGADMVFLESENPESLRDTYTAEDGKPQTDDCAGDWKLIKSKITFEAMGFETVRLLDTGDSEDRNFFNDSNPLTLAHRVIVSWGDSKTVDSIEENYSVGTIRFFEDGNLESFDSVMEREAEDSFTFQAANYQIPAVQTHYYLQCLTKDELIAKGLPKIDDKLHIVGFYPIIQSENSHLLHHMEVFGSYSEDCTGYEELLWGWGKGVSEFALPTFVGLPFNGEGEFNSFRINIHYNNPELRSDVVDSSGVRLYWTKKLRQHDIGLFSIGDPWTKRNFNPLGKHLSKHDFGCHASCTETFMDQPITVFREIHHAHRLGKRTVIDQYRDRKKIRSGVVDYWDFTRSGIIQIPQDTFIVEPGDAITMTCYYDDPGGNAVFGFDTRDEMCEGAYIYYPKVKKQFWMCGIRGRDPECSASYKKTKIHNIEGLGREFPFGDQRESCPLQ